MEPVLRLRDSYVWYKDLFTLPVDEAGMLFFAMLGYVDDHVILIKTFIKNKNWLLFKKNIKFR